MKQEHNSSLIDLQINMLFVIALKIFCVILLVWEDKLPQSSLPSYFCSLFCFFTYDCNWCEMRDSESDRGLISLVIGLKRKKSRSTES